MSMTMIGLLLLALLLVLVGLVGTLLPILPGVPLVFLGLLLAAWADDFSRVGTTTLVVLAVLMLLSFLVDLLATAFGARRLGAGPRAIWGALIGTVVGLFFGLPGLLLGPFIGAVAGELSGRSSLTQASRAGLGAWIGLIFGTLGKLALAFTMLGIFLLVWVW